ncbi:hypothetical protein [Actinocrispum wychmicini]|uniref:Uncharacterized protein n=1 Tax=Actinocrispum wychmicini TaxID=1213861 RepID=A0A4R2JYP6_9PSEU|nr:hypothetical protein [Actinocrispum wychmicini]TCO64382.1 hypothetical protein EV192_101150 [Actinocrispum wychmicini]
MIAYRNVRTEEVHEPEPGSWMAERLAGLPDIWEPLIPAAPAPTSPARPVKTARKADWVEYAMAHGHSREDAENLSRDDLARLFDDQEM